MQQRVAIARALAYQPHLLLMDEPFASVDAQTRADLEDLVLHVHADFGITVVFVTHDIDESVYLSDRDRRPAHRPTSVKEIVPSAVAAARPDRDEGAAGVRSDLRGRVIRLITGQSDNVLAGVAADTRESSRDRADRPQPSRPCHRR